MQLRIIAIILAFFIVTAVYSDTLVALHDVTFHSEFEKQVFNSFFNEDKEDFLALYLSMDSTTDETFYNTSKMAFTILVHEFKVPGFEKSKNKKKLKKVYNTVHSKLLDKYTIESNFSAIFTKGEYQCVTGSMLYSLVFDELQIPYEIKLLPDHTYLIAYPESDYILVETTNPLKGTTVFNSQFKSNYVDFLRDSKLISKEEYATETVDDLFDKYYNKPEVINRKQLTGAQYTNLALSEMKKMDFINAFNLMEKAYLFHPNENNSYLLFITLVAAIEQTSFKSDDYAKYLAKLMHFHGKNLSTEQLFELFGQLTYRQLEYEGNVEQYDRSYQTIIKQVSDSSLKSEISFLYNYERGRLLFKKQKFSEASPFIEKCYYLKPTNNDAETMFLGILAISLEKSMYNNEDKAEVLEQLETYKTDFPLLKENVTFNSYWLRVCLTLMDEFYYASDVSKGEKYRLMFEKKYPRSKFEFLDLNSTIVHSYATAASYYFKKGNYKKSREMINKGLHYAPNNQLLLERLRWLK